MLTFDFGDYFLKCNERIFRLSHVKKLPFQDYIRKLKNFLAPSTENNE